MTVLTAAPLTAAAITAGAELSRGRVPRIRILFGGVAGAVMLGLLGRVVPGAARALAGLVILTTMLGPGYDLLRALTRLVPDPTESE